MPSLDEPKNTSRKNLAKMAASTAPTTNVDVFFGTKSVQGQVVYKVRFDDTSVTDKFRNELKIGATIKCHIGKEELTFQTELRDLGGKSWRFVVENQQVFNLLILID